jgi:hypothetical protein
LLQLTNHPPDASLEMLTVDEFFARATQEEDWHDEEERETVKLFQNFVSVLKENLSANAAVFPHRPANDVKFLALLNAARVDITLTRINPIFSFSQCKFLDLAANIEPLVESLALRIGRNELVLVG